MRRIVTAAVSIALLAGCGIPRDPERTLDRVTGGTLRVGAIEHHPWVTIENGTPEGLEVSLAEAFAESIDAEVEWFTGSEAELFGALHLGQIDIVIGGVERTSPYSKEAALTHPYLTTQVVVGFPDEGNYDQDIAGIEVAVEPGTAEAGMLEKTDAVPVFVGDVSAYDGPKVVGNWLLDDLRLLDLGIQLDETDHVMAVRLGENAFMVELERFLIEHEDVVLDLLAEVRP